MSHSQDLLSSPLQPSSGSLGILHVGKAVPQPWQGSSQGRQSSLPEKAPAEPAVLWPAFPFPPSSTSRGEDAPSPSSCSSPARAFSYRGEQKHPTRFKWRCQGRSCHSMAWQLSQWSGVWPSSGQFPPQPSISKKVSKKGFSPRPLKPRGRRLSLQWARKESSSSREEKATQKVPFFLLEGSLQVKLREGKVSAMAPMGRERSGLGVLSAARRTQTLSAAFLSLRASCSAHPCCPEPLPGQWCPEVSFIPLHTQVAYILLGAKEGHGERDTNEGNVQAQCPSDDAGTPSAGLPVLLVVLSTRYGQIHHPRPLQERHPRVRPLPGKGPVANQDGQRPSSRTPGAQR